MDANTNLECAKCGKLLESADSTQYDAWDVQRKQKLFFCSSDCLSSWVKKKQITMILTLGLGILLTILMASELSAAAYILLFVPYMLRQLGGRLKGVASTGWVGEFIAFAVILFGSLTIIYPAIVLIQEIKEYVYIHKMLSSKKKTSCEECSE